MKLRLKCNLREVFVVVREKLCIHGTWNSILKGVLYMLLCGIVESISPPLSVFCTPKDDKKCRNYKEV